MKTAYARVDFSKDARAAKRLHGHLFLLSALDRTTNNRKYLLAGFGVLSD